MKHVNTDAINWTVVCVNEFARYKAISQKAAFQYLYENGGIEFLAEHYEAEHILSLDDVVLDLELICRNSGGML